MESAKGEVCQAMKEKGVRQYVWFAPVSNNKENSENGKLCCVPYFLKLSFLAGVTYF